MFNLVAQNDQQIRAIIIAAHENNGYDVTKDPMLDDLVKIGCLMTDNDACFKYLARLNDALVNHAKVKGVFDKMVKSGTQTLETQTTVEKDDKTLDVHKHYKVMSSYFTDYEGKALFNTGTLPPELKTDELESQLPGGAAKLTGFVGAPDFRKYLFQYAYHWKDPGVGWRHGEFTHRIHWYMIHEHRKDNPTWLKHEPLALFRACALPQWRHKKDVKQGVWDDIVDDFGAKTTFRSPETLHGSLKAAAEPNHPAHAKLWFLAQLVMGRAAKRAHGYTPSPEKVTNAKTAAGGRIMWQQQPQ